MRLGPWARVRRLGLVCALLVVVPAGLPARASPAPPTLRLFAASSHVTLYHYGKRVLLDLGVWSAAQGGDFQLDVSRPDYDSDITAAQVDSQTGEVLRTLPTTALAGFRGLREFTHVVFRDQEGKRVLNERFTFCPDSYLRARVDDQGPENSRYPFFCGTRRFPFALRAVWGIDDHWAVGALSSGYQLPFARIPSGRYSVLVRITKAFTGLLGIAEDQAVVRLHVRVVPQSPWDGGSPSRPDEHTTPVPEPKVPTVSAPDPSTLPDLVALPPWNVRTINLRHRDLLAFAANEWNAGPAPLVVEGFRRPDTDVMDAFQYFFDDHGNPVGRAPAGTLVFDDRAGHHHWHFEQFVRYSLLSRTRTEVVRSHKQSFCIAPTDAVDLLAPGADWQPWSVGLGSACGGAGSIWIREDLEVGWGDTYYQYLAGQAFDITRVPNGWYYLRSQVNPLGLLQERSTANNVEDRLVYLGGRRGHRTVLVAPWHDIRR